MTTVRSRRPRLAIVVALLAMCALLVPAGWRAPRAAAATVVMPTTGQITSGANTGYCLDNNAGSAVQGNPIDIYQCNQVWSSQVWTVEADGTVRIQNMCVDVHGGGTANGTQVLLNACNGSGSPGEQWQPQSNGTLLNVNSDKCLGINGSVAQRLQPDQGHRLPGPGREHPHLDQLQGLGQHLRRRRVAGREDRRDQGRDRQRAVLRAGGPALPHHEHQGLSHRRDR